MELPCLGTKVSRSDAEALRLKIYDELQSPSIRNREKFVGCHPITLTLNNVGFLLEEDFLVCEKSDGVRALLFVTDYAGGIRGYFYDRKNDFYQLDMDFPLDSTALLDGEIFLEDNTVNTYAIFDCLIYGGVPQINKNLYRRLGYAQMFVSSMKRAAEGDRTRTMVIDKGRKRLSIETAQKTQTPGMRFYVKEMLKSYGFWEIYKKIPELKHGNDGLIFTPVAEPYSVGKRGSILKWKPASLNTIDFKIRCMGSCVHGLVCMGRKGKEVVFDYFFGSDACDEIDGKIGEFLYDREGYYVDLDDLMLKRGGWRLYKIRNDKDTPNNIMVVCNILESLEDDLSIERLSTFYTVMRENSKNREMMRQSQ